MRNSCKLTIIVCLLILFNSCTNSFDYKKNDWVQITETPKENYSATYVDKNRIECDKEGNCLAWIKMIFSKDQVVPFSGTKQDQVSGYMLARRVDSSIKYFCNLTKVQIISYQIYDKTDKLIDSKWIRGDITTVTPGTVEHDLWRYVCMSKK